MPTNIMNFVDENQLGNLEESYTRRLKRAYRSINAVLSPDYVLNLKEKGIFDASSDGRILALFSQYPILSIHQATQIVLPHYSEEGHREIARIFARLFHLYFLYPVDIEAKLLKNASIFPLPSLAFTLGPAGARYLASERGVSPSEMGWSKSSLILNVNHGLHNLIVSEIMIGLVNLARLLTKAPNVSLSFTVANEWEGRLFPRAGGGRVIARPDYTFQIAYQGAGMNTPTTRTFFLEYDNGTENMSTLMQKIGDYNLAYGAAHFVLGSPQNTFLAFVFNKSERANRFVKTLYNTKRESSNIPAVYVATLDSVYQNGFFNNGWVRVDIPAMKQHQAARSAQQKDEEEIVWYNKESPFPEIHETLETNQLYPLIQSFYEQQVNVDRKLLKLEFETINDTSAAGIEAPDS